MITDCSHCLLYAELRGPRILAEIRKHATDESEVGQRWKGFLNGYHEIHPEQDVPKVMAEPGGSDARPAPPKGRATPSRSARPSDGRPARRHGEKNKPRTNDEKSG